MLKLTKKLLFAIEAVVDIAYHCTSGPVRSTDISDRQGIPRRYLEQVLQHLVHHDILVGQRGPRGGYRLARERRRITVAEIMRIVRDLEGGASTTGEVPGSEIALKVIRPIWNEVQEEMMTRFETLTIEELCRRARNEGVGQSEDKNPVDFSI